MRWEWLVAAGMLLIPVGLVFFAFGFGCLLRGQSQTQDGRGSDCIKVSTLAIGGLLFANFPAAAFYTWSAIDVTTRYTVEIVNDTGKTIDSFVLTAPGVHVELGPIQNGKRKQRHFQFSGDGSLDFSMRQQEVEISANADGYVTNGLGGRATIRLQPNGKYELKRNK